jgi:hypothetical protein
MTTAWKFLDADGRGVISRLTWPLPEGADGARPGKWVEVERGTPFASGVEAYRLADLSWWMSEQLWEVELDGDVVEHGQKVTASRGRLVRRVPGWPDVGAEMSRWAADRAWQFVVELLSDAGYERSTNLLLGVSDVARRIKVASNLHAETAGAEQFTLEMFVDLHGDIPDPVLTCHGSARTAGHRRSFNDHSTAHFRSAFAQERALQSAWTVDRLGLNIG